jgi:hypothetical protein
MFEWFAANRDALIGLSSVFSTIGAIAAVVFFVLALVQYWRSEKWKKTEFMAQLYKDFTNNDACRCAMWMLDGNRRTMMFRDGGEVKTFEYNFGILQHALRPRTAADPLSPIDLHVRDMLDHFFTHVEQFERAIENRLVRKDEVYPYFGYWIVRLNGASDLPEPIRQQLLEYVDAGNYKDVRRFLARWPGPERRS